jgi:hypothetical protein
LAAGRPADCARRGHAERVQTATRADIPDLDRRADRSVGACEIASKERGARLRTKPPSLAKACASGHCRTSPLYRPIRALVLDCRRIGLPLLVLWRRSRLPSVE